MQTFKEAIAITATGTTYSSVFNLTDDNEMPLGQADVAIAIPTVTGTTPSLTVTPQFSIDNVNWQDAKDLSDNAIAFTALTSAQAANVAVHKYLPRTCAFLRFKYVVTGTNPVFTGSILISAR